MGNHKLKWTEEEEDALKAGVAKHGAGKWKNILVDSEFKNKLANRSNVDLKDKWRNMGCNVGQGSGAKATIPRKKATATDALSPKTQTSSVPASKDCIDDKPLQSPRGVKNGPKYNEMILEALSSIKDHNGSDFGSILGFIEKKHEVPQSFRMLLSTKLTKLRKLVMQGKVEKTRNIWPNGPELPTNRVVQKRYKFKDAFLGIKTPSPKQKAIRAMPIQESRSPEIVEDAAKTAAQKIAEAEHKSFVAAEAVKEAERVSRMAEDADAMVMHLREIFEQWEDEADNRSSKNGDFF